MMNNLVLTVCSKDLVLQKLKIFLLGIQREKWYHTPLTKEFLIPNYISELWWLNVYFLATRTLQ